ncbi:MAG: flavohemoglobin expression-modulating QEGLA motif protein [Pseudomonadales bacterium]
MDLARLKDIDRVIVAAAGGIKVLSRLSWPADTMAEFIDHWGRGNPRLPTVSYPPGDDLRDAASALSRAHADLAVFDDPLANFLRSTVRSYLTLCDLLQSAGSANLLTHSRRLYGIPGDRISDGHISNLDAARHFLTSSESYYQGLHLGDADYCLPARIIKQELEARLAEVFPAGTIEVVVDPRLASKAAAGATRIRLRDDTCFSEYDLEQLLQHEAFVHSLTALNGRLQPAAQSLGLGAPRTTGPQEGLATFAEVVTGAIDIDRMKRMALRVVGIDLALGGADFLDVFRYFLDSGQPESESFSSTMRIFRGAPLTGGVAFTKDVVYLHGLMEIHTFFRWAMQHNRLELCHWFLAGRMTIADTLKLAPLFADRILTPPTYEPPWMKRINGLAGYLSFSLFANRISVEALGEHHRFERPQDLGD